MPSGPLDAVRQVQAVVASTRARGAETAEILDALRALRELREDLAAWEPELITAARTVGASWIALAPALGVASRQAAERRYLRLRPSHNAEATGEARVEAERDRRAGDRAVTAWARDNSSTLRQLAGQVGALDQLDAAGQEHAGLVQDALGDDDAAALLTPLAAARPHLRAEHAALADSLTAVSEHAQRLRRDAITTRHDRAQNYTDHPAPSDG